MKRLKAGPELKMPDLKVPDFLVDLYWDLRDRHLLPLVGLVVVAIVAVPFLLGGGSKESPPEPIAGVSAAPSPESVGSHLTVVEAKPGLRDYHKRLHHDSPTDPFKQRFTSPDLKGAKLGGGGEKSSSASSTSSTSTSTSTTTTTSEGGSSSPTVTTNGNGEPTAAGVPGRKKIVLFSFAIDVKITKTTPSSSEGKANSSEGKSKDESEVRHHVVPPGPLPSEKTAVITYMGINPKTRLPYFIVSDAVTGVFGDGRCLSGVGACQVIELEPGIPETFAVGDGPRYKFNVLDVEPVVAGHIE